MNFTVEQLVAMLASSSHFDRAYAARELCNMGMKAVEALPALLNLHNDPWYQVRIQVPRAIIHMNASMDQVEKILIKLLNDEDACVRSYAQTASHHLTRANPQ